MTDTKIDPRAWKRRDESEDERAPARDQNRDPAPREQDSEEGARHEDEGFDNQQTDDPCARRAERQTHGDFAASRHSSHQDEPRDVRARDQQDQQTHRAQDGQGRQHDRRGTVRCLPERHDPQPLDDRMAARSDLVRRQERAAPLGANAKQLKVVPGDEFARDLARASASAQIALDESRAHESRERAIVIADVLVVGIGHADDTSRARFAEDDAESGLPVNPRERGEREALEHRDDRGVQADAEREDADHGG